MLVHASQLEKDRCGRPVRRCKTTLQVLRSLLQPWVGSYADRILDREKLAEFVEQRQGQSGVSAQF